MVYKLSLKYRGLFVLNMQRCCLNCGNW